MEETWYVDRAKLRDLLILYPDWSQSQLAAVLGRSVGWVKKWCRRLRHADPNDATVLQGQPRARKYRPQRISETVIQRILEIRRQPPNHLQRVPGPLAIRYYLHNDETLKTAGSISHVPPVRSGIFLTVTDTFSAPSIVNITQLSVQRQ